MSEPGYVPASGDLVWLDFDPVLGHEQAGRRPALVLSVKSYARASGLVLVVPITSRGKGYPFEVPLSPAGRTRGVILADAIRCVDFRKRNIDFAERADAAVVARVGELPARLIPALQASASSGNAERS